MKPVNVHQIKLLTGKQRNYFYSPKTTILQSHADEKLALTCHLWILRIRLYLSIVAIHFQFPTDFDTSLSIYTLC